MQFVVFQMYAPLASVSVDGAITARAGGGVHEGHLFPKPPELLGLLGCCLGVDREDLAGMAALSGRLRFAVRIVRAGNFFLDFHIVQTYAAKRGQQFIRTRRDEIYESNRQHKNNFKYQPTARRYLSDSFFTVAVWGERGDDLVDILDALKFPHWTPYFGRKASPFGLPFNPQVISGETPIDALDGYKFGLVGDWPSDWLSHSPVDWIDEKSKNKFGLKIDGRVPENLAKIVSHGRPGSSNANYNYRLVRVA